ncbi:Oxalate decarboxylase [Mycena kentingensis (nom. inval.)]|nr:Oxalate decarboxylase [Mycena kentingensis (nom. inval.)]
MLVPELSEGMISLPFCLLLTAIRLVGVAAAPAVSSSASHAATSTSGARVVAAPSSTPASTAPTAPEPSSTVPLVSTDPNDPLWNFTNGDPQPIRGGLGAPILGPINLPLEKENPDILAPPTTDNGDVKNAKWPFDLSHMRLQTGGWARQENTDMLPIGTAMAAVDMRLEPGAIRELHWHTASEWAYVISGFTQISAVDTDGRNFLATVGPGDLWFFPPGIPHSLQATNQTEGGSQFLLVFDDGAFSDDGTFLLTDWMAHVSYEVIMKNFQTNNVAAFAGIPAQQLYIFPGPDPDPDALPPTDPAGQVPANESYYFEFSKIPAKNLTGGSIKTADTTNFPVSNTIIVAEDTINPGAMRELHWHPTMDEMDYFSEGTAQMTLFAAGGNARTFDYQPGDIGYRMLNADREPGHYIENTGNTTARYLEILNGNLFQDLSLNQWLALTPPKVVKAHLGLSDATIASLMKLKPIVI